LLSKNLLFFKKKTKTKTKQKRMATKLSKVLSNTIDEYVIIDPCDAILREDEFNMSPNCSLQSSSQPLTTATISTDEEETFDNENYLTTQEMLENRRELEANDYLNEYDKYALAQEKYLQAGNGGRQRNKRDAFKHDSRVDPSGNTRVIVNNVQNAERKRHLQQLNRQNSSKPVLNSNATSHSTPVVVPRVDTQLSDANTKRK
jgi:hypothetical protein